MTLRLIDRGDLVAALDRAAAVMVRYFVWVANGGPHVVTLDLLMEVELPVRLSAGFRGVVECELVTAPTPHTG